MQTHVAEAHVECALRSWASGRRCFGFTREVQVPPHVRLHAIQRLLARNLRRQVDENLATPGASIRVDRIWVPVVRLSVRLPRLRIM